MKPKQLANVLTKILGLFFCAQGAMHILIGNLNIYASKANVDIGFSMWTEAASGVCSAAIGFYFIFRSRKLSAFLMMGEDE